MRANLLENLKDTLAALPDAPGVYIMRSADGNVLYVGMATSLKRRVGSYFQPAVHSSPKTEALLTHVVDLETVLLPSPLDALALECNLIKEYKPPYNVQLRDDKHYPYLKLTWTEDYPRLVLARTALPDGDKYFGPYVSVGAMHVAEKIIRRLFPLRSCSNSQFKMRHRPCLNSQIGKCLAPCAGKISREEYRDVVARAAMFLEGRTDEVARGLKEAMTKAAEELRFEEAASLRDKLEAVRLVQRQQQMDEAAGGSRDVLALARDDDFAVVQVFFVRGGKVVGREHQFLDHCREHSNAEILEGFINQYYTVEAQIPPELCLPEPLPTDSLSAAYLQKLRGRAVRLILPQRGHKKRLLDLVKQNATLLLTRELEKNEKQQKIAGEAILDLQKELSLPHPPYRIECFDNSHLRGTYTVSSMVTFCGGLPEKSLYRRFRQPGRTDGDDYAAMREVLTRRIRNGLEERQALAEGKLRPDQLTWGQWPDLLLLDGGKGQLAVGQEILSTLHLAIPLAALAERLEEIYLPGRAEPVVLSQARPALQLLQQVRDEAHRTAIGYHRTLRAKGQVHSALDDIPGIGPKRRAALLAAFGSLAVIKRASAEELAMVEHMNLTAARHLYAYLHNGTMDK